MNIKQILTILFVSLVLTSSASAFYSYDWPAQIGSTRYYSQNDQTPYHQEKISSEHQVTDVKYTYSGYEKTSSKTTSTKTIERRDYEPQTRYNQANSDYYGYSYDSPSYNSNPSYNSYNSNQNYNSQNSYSKKFNTQPRYHWTQTNCNNNCNVYGSSNYGSSYWGDKPAYNYQDYGDDDYHNSYYYQPSYDWHQGM